MYKKIAFLTGGNRGIGKSISKKIQKNTFITITTTNHKENIKKFNTYLKKKNIQNIIIIKLSLTKKKIIKKSIKYINKKLSKPTIIINNAGINHNNLLLKTSEETWHDTIDINLNSIYLIIKYLLPNMIMQKWGRIINISSIESFLGYFI